MFRYALKRVARSYRLFIALTVGVLLATTFFASTNVAADVLSKDALDASIEGYLFDFSVESELSNWTVSDIDALETDLDNLTGIVESTRSSQFVFELNNTGVNMTLAGLEMSSDLTTGLQLISGRSTLGPNETYIVSGSANESLFELDQIVKVEIVVLRGFNPPLVIQRNLTVAGYVYLPEDTRDSIIQSPSVDFFNLFSGGDMSALGLFSQSSYNLMLSDWDLTVQSILEEASEVSLHTKIAVRNLIHLQIDRDRYLDPYDIGASLSRLGQIEASISSRSSQYDANVISNLEITLTLYQFTQLGMNLQFVSLSLPIFLLAYFTGTMVSDVGYNFRRREIGLLLTKGYQNHTIKRMFLIEGALVGGIAGAVSIFLGTAAAYFVLGITGVNFVTAVLSNSVAIILSIIVGMFLGLFSVWRPAGRASKLEILDALKQYIYVEDVSEYKRLLPTISL
ncbi:MAG: ABC transporter permease, partial [Candidatus Sifarchaeia archaeon]